MQALIPHVAHSLLACLHRWCVHVPPVQFFIAYRLGHDLVSNKVGSFNTQDIFRGEVFFNINSDTGSGTPAAVCSKRLQHSTCLRSAPSNARRMSKSSSAA
jgi:hypothetical protein